MEENYLAKENQIKLQEIKRIYSLVGISKISFEKKKQINEIKELKFSNQ